MFDNIPVILSTELLGKKPRLSLDQVYPERTKSTQKGKSDKVRLPRNWHMTGMLKNVPCAREGEAVYASNFRSGPKWMSGVLKPSTGKLLSQFNWKIDNCLENTKTTLNRGRASSKSLLLIKSSLHCRQWNGQNHCWKNL